MVQLWTIIAIYPIVLLILYNQLRNRPPHTGSIESDIMFMDYKYRALIEELTDTFELHIAKLIGENKWVQECI